MKKANIQRRRGDTYLRIKRKKEEAFDD